MEKLKPCPFCGGKVRIYDSSCFRLLYIEHESAAICFDRVAIRLSNTDSLSRVAEMWNRRVSDDERRSTEDSGYDSDKR